MDDSVPQIDPPGKRSYATTPQQAAVDELINWWEAKANDEVTDMAAKAIEYSAYDLILIGRVLADTLHREVSDEEATELGIYFYLLGKVGRWSGAIREGRRPSSDTLLDIGVYSRMAQRVRDVGGWPNG